jgi:uroporphyrin-III C-methyltransferase
MLFLIILSSFSSFLFGLLVAYFILPWLQQRQQLHHHHRKGKEEDEEKCEKGAMMTTISKVVLVGAGPGDPELLTLSAVAALQRATVVISDVLVCEEIISRFVRSGTTVLIANKRKGFAHPAQEEINQWMLDSYNQGNYVVRLKGGDPFLYGRGTEEIQFLHKHHVDVEVIPGISSALAGPLACGVSVTSRGIADQFLVATAHGKNDKIPDIPPYFSGRTVVFLMSVSRLGDLCSRLKSDTSIPYPLDTPVRIVENATKCDKQRSILGTISTIVQLAEENKIKSPSIIIIGTCALGVGSSSAEWKSGHVLLKAPPEFLFPI